jgi:hypothetical protein
MSVITDAEAWNMVRRLDAKADALLKPPATVLGVTNEDVAGYVARAIWSAFVSCELPRDHYPYSEELRRITSRVNRLADTALESWHVWGLLCRTHKLKKNWGSHKGKRSPYLSDVRERFSVSVEQMRAMGAVPLMMAGKHGDDVAMTHIITRAANKLFRSGWGDWADERFTFNAMLSCRKSSSRRLPR